LSGEDAGAMKIRRYAQLESDLPYDGVEDERDFVVYPGKNIAEAVGEVLARQGCTIYPMLCLDEQGWEFDFVYRKLRLVCRTTMIEDYLVLFYDPSWFRGIFKRTHPGFVDILRKVGDAMAQDSRFRNVRWFDDEHVLGDEPGAAGPADD
jgi:hypothetical protein